MKEFVLHSNTELALQQVSANPLHAYLFWGPKGLGKTTLAQYIGSQALASQSIGDRSKWILSIACEENKKKISLAQVKLVLEFLYQKLPPGVQKKVVIIDDAEKLSIEAANSLLKVLEEPPPNSLLILVSQHPQALPTTIRSRLAQVEFKNPTETDILQFFENSNETKVLLDIVGSQPATIAKLLSDETARGDLVELHKAAQDFFASDLARKLAISTQVQKSGSEKLFFEVLCHFVNNDPTASAALIFADKHLYNSGNPRFVLEHLALELT